MRYLFTTTFLLFNFLLAAQRKGHDRAVLFPVTDYSEKWHDLPETSRELKLIKDDLEEVYGFNVDLRLNQNAGQIRKKLAELAEVNYKSDDQLLLFFSMHGTYDVDGEAGFLVPHGGKYNDKTYETWLSHHDLRTLVTKIPCNHILLVLDACSSNTFAGTKSRPEQSAADVADCQTQLRQAFKRKTRLYLTYGDKKVPAKSKFVEKLHQALMSKGGEDGILDFEELNFLLTNVKPVPKSGDFTGHEHGSFLFVSKNSCQEKPTDNKHVGGNDSQKNTEETTDWRQAKRINSIEGYQNFIKKWCSGRDENSESILCEEAKDKLKEKVEQAAETDNIRNPKENMLYIRGGDFEMGSNESLDEKPIRMVRLSNFYLSKFEVTVAEFRQFIQDTEYMTDAERAHSDKTWRQNNEGDAAEDNHPVVHVSWNDATAYCKWRSKKSGKKYRLPTEAEWEFVAGNGRRHTKYSWGAGNLNAEKGENLADETGKKRFSTWEIFAGYSDNFVFTAPVGSFFANDFGLCDLGGNVSEWCSDWYDSHFYKSPETQNPKGPDTGGERVVRGAAWNTFSIGECRVAKRNSFKPNYFDSNLGFRVAVSTY